MSRADWILRPLPNALMAMPLVGFAALSAWAYGSIVFPLIAAGAAAGLVSGVMDMRSRRDIAERLLGAASLGEVIMAYRFSPWGRFKNTATLASLAIAWFSAATDVGLPTMAKFPILFAAFGAVDLTIRAVLGIQLKQHAIAGDAR